MYKPHRIPTSDDDRSRRTAKLRGGKEVVLGPGGVVVFPPNQEHSTRNAGDGLLVLEEIFTPGMEALNELAPKD